MARRDEPGPLLLLPLTQSRRATATAGTPALTILSRLVRSESRAAHWVRTLLGRVTAIDSGRVRRRARRESGCPANVAAGSASPPRRDQ